MNEIDKAAATLAKAKNVKDPWDKLTETQKEYWRGQVAATTRPSATVKKEKRTVPPKQTATSGKGGTGKRTTAKVNWHGKNESETAAEPTYEELTARVAELEADKNNGDTISFKVSEKGACSVYGLGRFPVTLYYEQWMRLLNVTPELEDFLKENKSKFKLKEG